ncbi:hypothetical protein [Rhodococcus sp. SGAir0479]|uniref:hypothetical protein n=1 Tax=Rhodococcus sp. SGAir0479 TaxID=2567884 RepID=UPI0010CD3BF6|nr:hypothetical protein [Rhodococcus sp. SGAir0479]QCQ92557.1 hypothetical protein E7742_15905 [Rhodococcus sp. SGAir0479]
MTHSYTSSNAFTAPAPTIASSGLLMEKLAAKPMTKGPSIVTNPIGLYATNWLKNINSATTRSDALAARDRRLTTVKSEAIAPITNVTVLT